LVERVVRLDEKARRQLLKVRRDENIAGSYPAINNRVGAVYGNNLGGGRAGEEEPEGYERGEVRHLKERKGEEDWHGKDTVINIRALPTAHSLFIFA
jgi:hypothetical protein